ncbi:MAG: glycoside hydrolase family 57 protein [Nanobdellota archaeon]
MVAICFYFQVHQPIRLRHYNVFDIGNNSNYFDDNKNREVMQKVARKCYLPMNALLLKLINRYKDSEREFKVSFSITGTAMEQFKEYAPEVLQSFKDLAKTGCVEFLSETYHHSLSYLFSKKEFKEQVDMHKDMIKEHFGQEPKVFRNTEIIFNNEIGKFVEDMGYKAVIAEGVDNVLGWRSPNFVYRPVSCNKIKLLLKNYKLSDDIAFRFSNKGWKEWPLSVEKYCSWINSVNGGGEIINLFMDYETFGEHQWEDTGIFSFMENLPEEFFKHSDSEFITCSEAADRFSVKDDIDMHNLTSWADVERDLSAWLGNKIQNSAIYELFEIENKIKGTKDKKLIDDWKKLTTSDHFYYMCTKWFNDGDVHKYFNPYDSPYDSFISFMNVLQDINLRIDEDEIEEQKKKVTDYKITPQQE